MDDPHDDTDVPSGTTDGAQMERTSPPVPRRDIAAALRTMDGAHDLTKVFPVIVRERQRRNGQAQ